MQEGEGWVKLFRKFTEWEWYGDINTKTVFIHLLLIANFEEKRWMGRIIERGQAVIGLFSLSEELGLSIQQIRTALGKLESTGEISRKSTNRFTIVTICKYEQYQQVDECEQQTNNNQITNEQQTNNNNIRNKEYKNINPPSPPSVRAYACACERKPVEEYLTEVLMDDSWVEATCMNHRIDKFTLVKMSEDFKTECKCNGKETADSLQDAKHHFNSWLRIVLEKERKQEKEVQDDNQRNRLTEDPTERLGRILRGDIRN